MDFDAYPRKGRRPVPTAPPEYEPDHMTHRRPGDEYRSKTMESPYNNHNHYYQEESDTDTDSEDVPPRPSRRPWYSRNYFSEMGLDRGSWGNYYTVKALYAVQLVLVFVARVFISLLQKTFNTGWLFWLVNWLVIKPIIAPYVALVRKARWIYRASNYAYNNPSIKSFLAWLWLKITGNLPAEEPHSNYYPSSQHGQFPPQPQFQQAHTQHRSSGTHAGMESGQGIWTVIMWLLSFVMLPSGLIDLLRGNRDDAQAWSSYSTTGRRNMAAEPVSARTRSHYPTHAPHHPQPSAPHFQYQGQQQDYFQSPPAYDEATQGTETRRHNDSSGASRYRSSKEPVPS